MRAPISIIIPTLNAAGPLAVLLGDLGHGLAAGIIREVVVSDGGSGDDVAALCASAGVELTRGAPGRGGQLARGVATASGEWFFLLHADTRLPEGWPEAVVAHLARPDVAGYGRLEFAGGGAMGRLVAGWANLRSDLFGLPYGDQGLLISRALYEAVGGYEDIPLMEDVAMARALGKGRLAPLDLSVETSPARYQARGWLRQGGRNLICLLRYLLGADPHRLARFYRA